MKDNREILNEAFFKKATYEEKLNKKLAQYAPVNPKTDGTLGTPFSNVAAYQVTDTDEVKRRLTGSFGVAFGNNNVKGMASKALKTFPILISDNIEPETAVMLKKLTEEQYAEYINLLISNQVVNLADYSTNNPDGNIAIQALDTISGTDFSKSRLGNKALKVEKITTDDVFANVPLYNLLRESKDITPKSGNALLDSLLEDAVILPNDKVNDYIDFLCENIDDIETLNELRMPYGDPRDSYDEPLDRDPDLEKNREKNKEERYNRYRMGYGTSNDDYDNLINRDVVMDKRRGFEGMDAEGKEIYSQLTTADIVLDPKRLDQAINKSIGEFLCLPENYEIRDRFEKATFLLQSRKIAGVEYYNYLTMRLGIPVSDSARKVLVTSFKVAEIRDYTKGNYEDEEGHRRLGFTLSSEDQAAILQNRKRVDNIVQEISSTKLEKILRFARDAGIVGAIGGATSFLATKLGVYLSKKAFDKGPAAVAKFGEKLLDSAVSGGSSFMFIENWVLHAIIGSAVGLTWAIVKLIKRIKKERAAKRQKEINKSRIYGWERVEKLILDMEAAQSDIRSSNITNRNISVNTVSKNEYKNASGSDYDENKNYLYARSSRPGDPRDTDLSNSFTIHQNGTSKSVSDDEYRKNIDLYNSYRTEQEYYRKQIEKYNASKTKALITESEEVDAPISFYKMFNNMPEDLGRLTEEEVSVIIRETIEELRSDKEYMAQLLSEKVLAKTSMPVEIKYVEKDPSKDTLIVPTFGARTNYAYGSTEIERKENKDRKYNQPLIMTIKFKERFADDKYSDNELTAVIGILGKIIRIPSSEMQYILEENINDKTINGIFQFGNIGDTIGDMFAIGKISKDVKNLPISADIWHNLEKVSALALANKVAGKRSNNIANAHIVFSQKEIDAVRTDTGIDYSRDARKTAALMKRYNAFTVMIANDAGQRLSIFDDPDNISWNVVPYSAVLGKDGGEQLNSVLTKMMRL